MNLEQIPNPVVRKYGWYILRGLNTHTLDYRSEIEKIKARLNELAPPDSNWVIKAPMAYGAEYKLYADDDAVAMLVKLIA